MNEKILQNRPLTNKQSFINKDKRTIPQGTRKSIFSGDFRFYYGGEKSYEKHFACANDGPGPAGINLRDYQENTASKGKKIKESS